MMQSHTFRHILMKSDAFWLKRMKKLLPVQSVLFQCQIHFCWLLSSHHSGKCKDTEIVLNFCYLANYMCPFERWLKLSRFVNSFLHLYTLCYTRSFMYVVDFELTPHLSMDLVQQWAQCVKSRLPCNCCFHRKDRPSMEIHSLV